DLGPARARVHGRGVRLRAALRPAAIEEADPHDPEAGARARCGMVLSTQNPVDLDYKAMSNAGTWMVGRLQTARDKARVIEALKSAAGDVDVAAWDARIGALGKRQFLLRSAGRPAPALFTTRWAMSYLRGPLT